MKSLLLALFLVAPCAASCKHSTSSSSTTHTETSTTTDSTSSESGAVTTTTTTSEAPGETTTTTNEYAPPEKETAPQVSEAPQGGDAGRVPVVAKPTVPRHGPLVKRTVTVTKSGGETTETRQEAHAEVQRATETREQAEADAKAQAASESKPSGGCIGASWVWGLAALAFAGLVIFGIVKFRKAV